MGIRQKLAAEFGSTPNKQGNLGRQHAADVTVTYLRTEKYYEELASSVFCGVCQGMAGVGVWKTACFKDVFLS